MDLLNRAKGLGANLLDFVVDYGQRQYSPEQPNALPEELATDPGVLAAQRAYDRNYRISRGEAIRKGARWYEMGDYGRAGAEQQYGADLMSAAKQAEAVKQMRDRSVREKAVRGLLDELDLTPQQRGFLDAVGPDAAQEILPKVLFPNLNKNNVATPGTIVGTKRARDGEILAVVQTGDPNEPVKVIPTGQYEDQSTSEMRTNWGYATDPRLAQGARIGSGADSFGREQGTVDAKAMAALPATLQSTDNSIAQLTRLQEELSQVDTGRLERYAELYDSRMQAINAELTDIALRNIAALQNEGVRLTPITEHELKILFDTSAKISNNPAANKMILERKINALRRLREEVAAQLRWLDQGNSMLDWRPPGYLDGAPPAGTAPPRQLGDDVPQPAPPPGAVLVPGAKP